MDQPKLCHASSSKLLVFTSASSSTNSVVPSVITPTLSPDRVPSDKCVSMSLIFVLVIDQLNRPRV